MKKIMKAFAAIAALAMVSSGFVACSDDEEEDTSPSLTIKTESALTAAAGEAFSVNATITLKNDSFAGDIPQGTDLKDYIEEWFVTDYNDFAAAPLVEATEAASEGAKTLKINISGYAADVTSTKNGTIKIKLFADAVKSGKSLTTNAIKYQFTAAGGNGGAATATISFDATAASPAFALTNGSAAGVFDNVAESFLAAGMESVGGVSTYTLADEYPKVESAKFTPSSASNEKVASILDTEDKASLTGYILKSTLVDGSTKVALKQDENCAYVTYPIALSAAADVSVDVTAFNSQSGNFYGRVVISNQTSGKIADSGAKTAGSKEDNDASVTASLAAGMYYVTFVWSPIGDIEASKGIKSFLGGVQSVKITATTN